MTIDYSLFSRRFFSTPTCVSMAFLAVVRPRLLLLKGA